MNNELNSNEKNKKEFFTTKGQITISHINEDKWIFEYALDKNSQPLCYFTIYKYTFKQEMKK